MIQDIGGAASISVKVPATKLSDNYGTGGVKPTAFSATRNRPLRSRLH
jgi:hypothetical protein